MGTGSSASRGPTPSPSSPSSPQKSPARHAVTTNASAGKDVMISYSHADKEVMNKVRDGLESSGIRVWVDTVGLEPGVDFLSKIGEAIIDSKMFITLLSSGSVSSKYCQDELALAYVSNKPIFPVGLEPEEDLFKIMDTGMKLQLVRYDWTMFTDQDHFEENLAHLIGKMETHKMTESQGNRRRTPSSKLNQKESELKFVPDGKELVMDNDEPTVFWEDNFKKREAVSWDEFASAFEKKYGSMIRTLFENTSDQMWIVDVLRRELQDDDNMDTVTNANYMKFCSRDGVRPFWDCIQDEFVVSYTMREVFNMESTVRVEAIQNLGKFNSTAVIEALKDLLEDKDNNIKAVAAISLAHTGNSNPAVMARLQKCLDVNDRLVREAGCLALGHLKSTSAVPKLIHLWRNDVISSVREAAQVALEQIGGDEAKKAMHMTRVLADEIHMLTNE